MMLLLTLGIVVLIISTEGKTLKTTLNSSEPSSFVESRALPSSSCGKSTYKPRTKRIIGGTDANDYSWPWIVSLQLNGVHQCGGSIIDAQHVLTAAHCFSSLNPAQYTVVAGTNTLSSTILARRIGVSQIVRHEQYVPISPYPNDIAIVRVSTPFDIFKYNIFPICLSLRELPEGASVIVAGWGQTNGLSATIPDKLQQITLEVMNQQAAREYGANFIPQQHIGAGSRLFTGRGPCYRDSGGPLMYEVSGMWSLAGVVSNGETPCLKPQYRTALYMKTSYYYPWINNILNSAMVIE